MRDKDPDRSGPRTSSLWLLAAAVLLSQLSFGAFLNDEAGQLQGLHNLVRGDLGSDARSPHFYAVFEGVLLPEWDNQATVGSGFVDFASVPAYFLFKALDPVASGPALLLLAWAAASYVAVKRAAPRLASWRGKKWSWYRGTPETPPGLLDRVRTMTPSHVALAASLLGVLAAGWASQPRLDFALWGEVYAAQATNVALGATAFALFWRLVEDRTGSPRAAGLAFAALLVGPALFWASGIKYHGAGVFLAVLALWLYARPDRWRALAFPVAVLGVWNTILGAPLLAALVVAEVVRASLRLRDAEPGSSERARAARSLLLAAGAAVVAIGAVSAYNQAVYGRWSGRIAVPEAGAWTGVLEQARFESVAVSLQNVLRVFVHSRGIEGYPVAVLALTPLVVLGLVAVARMLRRPTRCRDPVLWVAAGSNLLFALLFVHGSHTQGSGMDNRFWIATLPGWLLLAADLLAPRLDRFDARVYWRAATAFAAGLVVALTALAMLDSVGAVLDDANPFRQVLWAADGVGTVAWLAVLWVWMRHDALLASVGRARLERRWGTVLGLAFVAPALWLVMASLVVHREIPPWPFFQGREGLSFLLPGLDGVAEWAGRTLVP